jgi:hypothetical protein
MAPPIDILHAQADLGAPLPRAGNLSFSRKCNCSIKQNAIDLRNI